MGWWSTAIMGGDTPLDIEYVIFEAMDIELMLEDEEDNFVDETYDEHIARVRATVKPKHIKKAWNAVQKIDYDLDIAYQVLGVLLMKYGLPITQEQKQLIIDNAKWDNWAQDEAEENLYPDWVQEAEAYDTYEPTQDDFIKMLNSSERGRHVLTFLATIDRYTGEPTELGDADQGLLVAIAEHIQSGAAGLVNK